MAPANPLLSLARSYRRAYSGLPRGVWWVALAALVNRAGTMVTVFLPVWLVRVHGLEDHAAIQFMGLFGAGAVAGTLLGGWLTDRFRPLPVQLGSLCVVAVLFILLERYSGSGNLVPIAVLLGLIGLASQAFRPANDTLLANLCSGAQRTRGFALHRLALNLGWTVGPVVGGLLADVSWSLLFWADALTCLGAAAVLWIGMRGQPGAGKSSSGDPVQESASEPGRAATRGPLADPLFLALALCTLLIVVVFLQFLSTLTVYLTEGLGWSPAAVGAAQALNPALIILFEMLLVQRLEHRDPLRVVAWGALCIALGFGLLGLSSLTGWIVLCIALLTVGEILNFPFASSFVATRATDRTRGRYLALHGLAGSIALLIAPVLGGSVREHLGWKPLWLLTGAVGLVATLGFAWLVRAVRAERARQ